MRIDIKEPVGLNEIGGRTNNEDSVYPLISEVTSGDKLFLVCDGVGGASKGEVASKMACDGFLEFFSDNKSSLVDDGFVNKALNFTERKFDEYLENNPLAVGMGTTLTLLYLGNSGATIAHIGDSRVYHIRDKDILHVTEDHSLVNQLVKANILTPEAAIDHPQRNVITRAIQGSQKKTCADVVQITNIQKGDYFFMCSDGILEQFDTDEKIVDIVVSNFTNDKKISMILQRCKDVTKDNFTCFLIEIDSVINTQNCQSNDESPTKND